MASGKSGRPALENPSILIWILAVDAVLLLIAALLFSVSMPGLLGLHFALFSMVAFTLFAIDKQLARRQKRRVSETNLLASSALGGALGALVGMLLFRHKTQHGVFKVGIPILLFIHVVTLSLVASSGS